MYFDLALRKMELFMYFHRFVFCKRLSEQEEIRVIL